jgi:hypothetical protein
MRRHAQTYHVLEDGERNSKYVMSDIMQGPTVTVIAVWWLLHKSDMERNVTSRN